MAASAKGEQSALQTDNLPTLKELALVIPKECFQKLLRQSFYYMFRDLALLSTAFLSYPHIILPIINTYGVQSWLAVAALVMYWNIYGFVMWCIFVVGHDCGHGSFSNSDVINAICGHLCHMVLCVPFYPWAYSHWHHHRYHNHLTKDMSHPWFQKGEKGLRQTFGDIPKPFIPFVAYFGYLYLGLSDGLHWLPLGLYRNATTKDRLKCLISTLSVISFLSIFYFIDTVNLKTFALSYGGCWVVFSFWLFLVTYFQHHSGDTVVYTKENWSFIRGAFETIDRKFGFGIDDFHHNITDGHFVHHLFFTKIPHYHLKNATAAMQKFLANGSIHSKYQKVEHGFFLWDFWCCFFKHGFEVQILDKANEAISSTKKES